MIYVWRLQGSRPSGCGVYQGVGLALCYGRVYGAHLVVQVSGYLRVYIGGWGAFLLYGYVAFCWISGCVLLYWVSGV